MAFIEVLKINFGDDAWYRRASSDGLAAIDPVYYEPPDEFPFYFLPLEILTWPMMDENIRELYLDLDTVEILLDDEIE